MWCELEANSKDFNDGTFGTYSRCADFQSAATNTSGGVRWLAVSFSLAGLFVLHNPIMNNKL